MVSVDGELVQDKIVDLSQLIFLIVNSVEGELRWILNLPMQILVL